VTKFDHIDYWKKSANEDWESVLLLFNSGRYVHSLFFAHLYLEKLCKALWVKYNEANIPLKTHNLVKLLLDTDQEFNNDYLKFLEEFNDFQLEGRYPDYLFKINQICSLEYTTDIFKKILEIKQCLIEKLQ
jgi:HEPN domain-containing protein